MVGSQDMMIRERSMEITIDMLFSYWILIWFVVYIFLETQNTWIRKHLNPLLAFYFGLVENIISCIQLLVYGAMYSAIQFSVIIIVLKMIPIYLLRKHPIDWSNDLFVLLFLFALYNLYLMVIKKTNIWTIYHETTKSISNNENRTPLLSLIHRQIYNK